MNECFEGILQTSNKTEELKLSEKVNATSKQHFNKVSYNELYGLLLGIIAHQCAK